MDQAQYGDITELCGAYEPIFQAFTQELFFFLCVVLGIKLMTLCLARQALYS